ncbi:MAG: division/cell wall cluster transcriptional repressor MraZ [Alphaproteobacteria bacterium]|nr:division/cell wall cluster transcriptional repressor MraZ [Alphaproteobacteria bacterium]
MQLFMGSFLNRLDKKGRISVPAPFRAALSNSAFPGVVAFPSFSKPAIEAGGIERMQKLSEGTDGLPAFSTEQDDLAALIFASAHQLAFDGDGRVVLPEELTAHARISEQVLIVGLGKTFEIWQPDAFKGFRAEALKRAQKNRPTLKLGGGE